MDWSVQIFSWKKICCWLFSWFPLITTGNFHKRVFIYIFCQILNPILTPNFFTLVIPIVSRIWVKPFLLISKKILKSSKKKVFPCLYYFNPNLPMKPHQRIIKECLNYLFYLRNLCFHEHMKKFKTAKTIGIAILALRIIILVMRKHL